ncbi:hypothetical protein EOM39_02715 [Candidatus Gracilibacteria bacterium]|nr:hypothetical protein [Candidatus Gracilibacteria bacterium]
MISKKYRLSESNVKKVLKFGKPFFSYGMVLNYKNNNVENNRFAIIISGKNISGSVERNFFRRRFYEIIELQIKPENGNLLRLEKQKTYYDLVFVLKKQTILSKKNLDSVNSFDNDIKFLLKKTNLTQDI